MTDAESGPGARLAVDGSIATAVLIVGSGPGGSAAAHAFAGSGLDVLVAERGSHLPSVPRDEIVTAMHVDKRYANTEKWYDASDGKPFTPGTYYYVGGNTKFYGAALPRFRRQDFERTPMQEGFSQGWPFGYAEMEPYYTRAEKLYRVHGRLDEDPTEPEHSEDFPFPALEHEPDIERFAASLRAQGLHPYHTANGLEVTSQAEREEERASDGTPSFADRKSDAWNRLLKPALDADERIQLLTELRITRLIAAKDGRRLVAAEGTYRGKPVTIHAERIILAAGAANTAALLLRSGVANSSDLVGRNYMVHNTTFLVGVHPLRRNRTAWQKTIGVNDWYLAGDDRPPLGNMQMLGKLSAEMLKGFFPLLPRFLLKWVTDRSIDLCLISEDVADPGNRVTADGERIVVRWKRNNLAAHQHLVGNVRKAVRKAGFPFVFTRLMGIATNSHMCGTTAAGTDPASSVVDENCRAHDLDNLWIVDSSVFPSSAASNPVLTISANALRVADKIRAALAP
ncbi:MULTISPECIES: GMC oxidoreductase [Amycolatopsis]|nr:MULTISPECIES: GMC family oxidoreductase [Amycolatopsis]OAP21583.1 6'''-hydroxyparomomycin C oxidase [Amycolatopsis sp. M39]